MTDPAEYLTARFDEEEKLAVGTTAAHWYAVDRTFTGPGGYPRWRVDILTDERDSPRGICDVLTSAADAEHIGHWDPVRVLADVAAKRALLALWVEEENGVHSPDAGQLADRVLQQLLSPYGKRAVWTREGGWRVDG